MYISTIQIVISHPDNDRRPRRSIHAAPGPANKSQVSKIGMGIPGPRTRNQVMWVKQCHLHPPNFPNHHFYSWDSNHSQMGGVWHWFYQTCWFPSPKCDISQAIIGFGALTIGTFNGTILLYTIPIEHTNIFDHGKTTNGYINKCLYQLMLKSTNGYHIYIYTVYIYINKSLYISFIMCILKYVK